MRLEDLVGDIVTKTTIICIKNITINNNKTENTKKDSEMVKIITDNKTLLTSIIVITIINQNFTILSKTIIFILISRKNHSKKEIIW